MESFPPLNRSTLCAGLDALGVRAGMGLIVHSSLSSLGYVVGGAPTVIAALMDVLTPQGTLLMPSFNHGMPFKPGGPGCYDPLRTPTINGAIPDAFWRMPDVRRSLNPTHPFAAWGKNAERYVQNHHRTLTMGADSPLGLLLADDGYGLLLGVDYRANTFHHVVETLVKAPCLGRRSETYAIALPDGRQVMGRTWGWRNGSCPWTDQNRYALLMAVRGLYRQKRIGPCTATLFRLRDGLAVIESLLRQGNEEFPPCSACSIRPRQVAQTVLSDWDDEHHCLRPDSEAWTF